MIDAVVHFLFYSLPWWAQMGLIAIPVAAIFLVLGQMLGWERVRVFIGPAVGVIAALGLLSRSRQQGYADRRAEEEKALDRAEEIHGDIEDKVERMPDQELDGEVDRWSRK